MNRKRNKRWAYTPPASKVSKETPLNHPSGSPEFVHIPELSVGSQYAPAGPVYLRHGWHRPQAGKGEGALHIWAGHEKELKRLGYETFEQVVNYVADILVPGSKIYVEGPGQDEPTIQVVQNKLGKVLLYSKCGHNGCFYNVLTAYPGNAQGTLLGSLD